MARNFGPAAGLLVLLAAAGADADTLPQAIADKFGAKCLNGQPPPYEVQLNASSTKWVLFLEGGGWWVSSSLSLSLSLAPPPPPPRPSSL